MIFKFLEVDKPNNAQLKQLVRNIEVDNPFTLGMLNKNSKKWCYSCVSMTARL